MYKGIIHTAVWRTGMWEWGRNPCYERSFSNDDNQGALLADASNAFNCLNRHATLISIHILCPPPAWTLTNTYRLQSSLFIGKEVIYSKGGTTQGYPLAMPMYAMDILPLIQRLSPRAAKQVWFEDDGTAGGKLNQIRLWWSLLNMVTSWQFRVMTLAASPDGN